MKYGIFLVFIWTPFHLKTRKIPYFNLLFPKDIEVLNNSWKAKDGKAVVNADFRDKTFSRKRTLPVIAKDTMLVIRNNYRGVQVCIDQDVRLDYGYRQDDTTLLGNVYIRVPLTPKDSDKGCV